MAIDTVKILYHVPFQEINVEDWLHKSTSKGHKEGEEDMFDFWVFDYFSENKTMIRLKYIPYDWYGHDRDMLFIEFSLPKLVHGCNHQLIGNWESAFDCANRELSKIPGLPPLGDIRDAMLFRLDLCSNLQLEIFVSCYLQVLAKGFYPRRTLHTYLPNGVTFRTKNGISTSFYDKAKECGHPGASGILRMEISMRKKNKIVKWLGKKNPTLRDLTLDLIVDLLKKDLVILHLDKPIISEQLEIEVRLSAMYSQRRVRSLLGYWLESKTYTRDQMLANGYTRQTIHNYEKRLRDADISSLSIHDHIELPPLSIETQNVSNI
jgi:hypothetical protein